MAVLRKANANSVLICRSIEKINNVKEDPKEKH